MNIRTIRRSIALGGGALLTGSLLLAPTVATAAPVVTETADNACTVTSGTLMWGVKESFRSYISGAIANGSWEPSAGATYETPNFQWDGGTGEYDPETGIGIVHFAGTVHFTGHDGVLDLTMANPTIEFEGDGKAALLLDVRSTDAQGELAIDTTQEWVGEVEAPSQLTVAGSKLDTGAMPTVLTNSGAKAFAGFYEAGAELDPITVALTFDNCENGAALAPDEPTAGEAVVPISEEAPALPWLPIGIGGAALFVTGLTVGLLIRGRRKPTDPTYQGSENAPHPI